MTGNIQKQEGKGILGSKECVIYLVDVSGSMSDHMDNGQQKIEVMQEALKTMLGTRVQNQGVNGFDQVAVISFGGDSMKDIEVVMALKVPVRADVDRIRFYTKGNTPMLEGLTKAVEILDRHAEGLARIIIFSDGKPTKLEDIKEMVRSASDDYGIIVDAVGIGTKQPSDGGYGYDGSFMRELATIGHGEFFDMSDGSEAIALLGRLDAERRALIPHGVFLLPSGK